MALGLSEALAREENCYLTTTGRVSGCPRTIEIWFAIDGNTVYMLSGYGKDSHWVKNALQYPKVSIKINEQLFEATARHVRYPGEDALARRLLYEKYTTTYSGDLSEWQKNSLPMAFDLI